MTLSDIDPIATKAQELRTRMRERLPAASEAQIRIVAANEAQRTAQTFPTFSDSREFWLVVAEYIRKEK